jgi:UDP-2-acetamido-2-deoxy-ribo-hexuluronate aminotransferase
MTVPFIDLKRFESGFLEQWKDKVSELSKNASFIGGEEVAQLESKLSEYTLKQYTVTCGNGTDAIQLALRAINVEKDEIVLVPNMTFWATFEAVVNVGAKPVTVDSDISDGGVCFKSLLKAIDKYEPTAVIIAHIYGWASNSLLKIREHCKLKNIPLVEDGAQCFGTTFMGKSIYEGAHIATTSFYPAKVLGGAGDGGAVFTDNEELATRVRQLANHGRTSHYGYGLVGWNSRLDSLQAAYLNISLGYLDKRIESRRNAIAFYNSELPKLGFDQMLAPADFSENGYCNVCLIRDKHKKDAVQSILKENNIGFANIYPGTMSEQICSDKYMLAHVGGTGAEDICSSVLNLPVFPYIKQEELEFVVNTLKTVKA